MKLQPRIPREVPSKSVVKEKYKRERTAAAHVKTVGQIGICAATGTEAINWDNATAQLHKSVTAGQIAASIRALPPPPAQPQAGGGK